MKTIPSTTHGHTGHEDCRALVDNSSGCQYFLSHLRATDLATNHESIRNRPSRKGLSQDDACNDGINVGLVRGRCCSSMVAEATDNLMYIRIPVRVGKGMRPTERKMPQKSPPRIAKILRPHVSYMMIWKRQLTTCKAYPITTYVNDLAFRPWAT